MSYPLCASRGARGRPRHRWWRIASRRLDVAGRGLMPVAGRRCAITAPPVG